MEQPRVHSSDHHAVSMNSTGCAARGPSLFVSASEYRPPPYVRVEGVELLGDAAEDERCDHAGASRSGDASSVTSAADPGWAVWPLKPSARQKGSS